MFEALFLLTLNLVRLPAQGFLFGTFGLFILIDCNIQSKYWLNFFEKAFKELKY